MSLCKFVWVFRFTTVGPSDNTINRGFIYGAFCLWLIVQYCFSLLIGWLLFLPALLPYQRHLWRCLFSFKRKLLAFFLFLVKKDWGFLSWFLSCSSSVLHLSQSSHPSLCRVPCPKGLIVPRLRWHSTKIDWLASNVPISTLVGLFTRCGQDIPMCIWH